MAVGDSRASSEHAVCRASFPSRQEPHRNAREESVVARCSVAKAIGGALVTRTFATMKVDLAYLSDGNFGINFVIKSVIHRLHVVRVCISVALWVCTCQIAAYGREHHVIELFYNSEKN